MKILQLTYESLGSPFGFGGAGMRAYEIYKRLKERHDITILCLKYPGAEDKEIGGLRHIFVGTESGNLTRSVFSYTVGAAGFIVKYGNDFDIIIENFLPAIPYFSRFMTRTPVVLQMQGMMGLHALKKFNIFFGLPMFIVEKMYPRLYNTYIFVSKENSFQKEATGILRSGHKMYTVIPNGVDRELLSAGQQERDYILFLSRIDRYTKGLDILIDAFLLLDGKFPHTELILAGYEFSSTKELIMRLPPRVRGRVRYAGFVSGDEKIRLLAGAKVFVLPSRHEAHPVSLLEAMACGRAVIVSDIPEMKYVGDIGAGLTFRSGSARDLSEKLARLLGKEELRKDLGDKGRQYASRFLWDDLALKFEKFLIEAAGRR